MSLTPKFGSRGGAASFATIAGSPGDNTALAAALAAKLDKAGGTMTGVLVNSANGAASTPVMQITGTPFTGGTGTSTMPQMLFEPDGSTPFTGWSTSGSIIGFNHADFSGNYMHASNGATLWFIDANGFGVRSLGAVDSTYLSYDSIKLNSAARVQWHAGSIQASSDLLLYRDAAAVLAQRNGTNAQSSRLYGTYTDGSNYRRLAMSSTDAGVFSIAPEGAGTGASGNVLHISGFPTSNPGPGILWNNAGNIAIGT